VAPPHLSPPGRIDLPYDMTNEELLGKHERLREELSACYAKPSWDTAHIDRITSELAVLERSLASTSPDGRASSCA
jgi:hypothetical protein